MSTMLRVLMGKVDKKAGTDVDCKQRYRNPKWGKKEMLDIKKHCKINEAYL